MISRKLLFRSAISALLSLAAPAARAQLHGSDIIISTDAAQRIITGRVDEATGNPANFVPQRVFLANMGAGTIVNDPGFNAIPDALPRGSRLGFDITRAVRLWNGTDFLNSAGTLRITASATQSVDTPPFDTLVEGFGQTVDTLDGAFHQHHAISLLQPADGVYLLERRLWNRDQNGGGPILDSLPFWTVINRNRPTAEFQAAAAWVRSNLATGPGVGCNRADLVTAGEGVLSGPDGFLTGDDFDGFIQGFFEETRRDDDTLVADLTDSSSGPNPDGFLTGADFDMFVQFFFEGC